VNPLTHWRWWRLARARAAAAATTPALAEALQAPSTPVAGAALLAIDLEMTGLDPARDQIISIGWVPLNGGAAHLAGSAELPILPDPAASGVGHSAAIHGIRDCDRGDGRTAVEALERLCAALGGRVAVFHHAPLDIGFLDRALRRHRGHGWLWPVVDTLDWFRRRQLRRDNAAGQIATSLDAARAFHGLDARAAHSALADALSCAELALVLAAHSRARLGDVCRTRFASGLRG